MKYIQNLAKEFVEIDGNKITFIIQDGTIPEVGVNGIQAMDMILILRELFDAMNKDFSCRENSLTITHLDEAYNWQMRRTHERELRGVEGKEIT
jgi:hypothetical protein